MNDQTRHEDRPGPGTPLLFRWRKWDGGAHWQHQCVYLGSDDWGDWLGQKAGWVSARPGRFVSAAQPNVTLITPSGEFAFTRNARPQRTRTYIDIAWDVRWVDGSPTGIDMDLDVVDHSERGAYIDDRDEFEEHRLRYGYPLDIVASLEQRAAELLVAVREQRAPYDEATPARWLERLAEHPLAVHPETIINAAY